MTARETVRSPDGTAIAYSRIGSGPPVILVDGALGRRAFGPAKPGGKSPPYMHHIAAHLARAIPGAQLRELARQTHTVAAPAIAAVLRPHFALSSPR